MKKFFHRFSAVEKGGVDTVARQRNDDSMAEKMYLQDGPTMTKDNKSGSGDRVKALAARFENLSGPDQKLQQNNGLPNLTPRSSSHRRQTDTTKFNSSKDQSSPSNIPPQLPPKDSRTTHRDAPPLQHFSPPLSTRSEIEAEDHTTPLSSVNDHPSNTKTEIMSSSSTLKPTSDSRDVNEATDFNVGNGTVLQQQMGNSKTVAFAPSPKKPSRPASPPPSMPIHEEVSSSGNLGNFAKATLASAARSRSATRQNTTVETVSLCPVISAPQSPTITLQSLSRPNSSLSTSRPQPRRSSSSTAPGRRGSSSEKGVMAPLSNQVLQPHSMASSLGFAQVSDLQANSIPFISPASMSHLRSASPQSIGTNSSRPTAYNANSNLGSRRGSWTGRVNSNGSVSQGWASSGTKSIGAPSWSEMTQEDLVSNLGARERTRQEVLWEIVASEERYFKELERTKEFYLDALLQPLQVASPASPGAGTKVVSNSRPNSMTVNATGSYTGLDYLGMDAAALNIEDRARRNKNAELAAAVSSPKSAKSNKSSNPKRWSNSRLAGQSYGSASSQIGYANVGGLGLSVPLPTSLRITLEAISNGLLQGHLLLSEALKQRYEEQWPLVRSLADVFTRYADVLQHYKDYVLHLERALECLEEAALMERAMRGKRLKKEKLTVMVGLGRAVASLESAATERGECSLAIFLAMPFQRLLKYPLLFQNLLFHTDASTYEFESTVKMVVDVEETVRSIEDEKVDKEERDKTLDGFARIEGIKDKILLKPKRDRMLIEEKALYEENPRRAISESNEGKTEVIDGGNKGSSVSLSSHNAAAASAGTLRAALKNKRSYRRLSDFLTVEDRPNQSTKAPNMGSKRDLWLVRFSDVELKCQRVGVTALPMVSSVVLQQPQPDGRDHLETKEDGFVMTEEEIKIKEEFKRSKESKERMKALRNTTLRSKTRNLYKFVSVTSWKQVQKDQKTEGDTLLDGLISPQEVDEEEEEEDEEEEDDDRNSNTSQETDIGVLDTERYVRQSKLSFSYWGNDKVEPKPIAITRTQSQHGSSAAAFRSRDISSPLTKRHSLTPDAIVPPSPAFSSKVVASNSQAKSKADKFGNRLRQMQETTMTTNNNSRMLSVSRLAGISKTSVVESTSAEKIQQTIESPTTSKSKMPSIIIQPRASLPQIQSVDSNLKLISSLIDGSEDDNSSWQ